MGYEHVFVPGLDDLCQVCNHNRKLHFHENLKLFEQGYIHSLDEIKQNIQSYKQEIKEMSKSRQESMASLQSRNSITQSAASIVSSVNQTILEESFLEPQ